jgi:LDH2 family malate/lactate/ureidoglycolate dehydrogenase
VEGAARVPLDEVFGLALRALRSAGAGEDHASAIAAVVTRAEADACASHGLWRVPGYVAALRSGRVDGRAVPVVDEEGAGIVRVDAARGFAPLAVDLGRKALIPKALSGGLAALAIARCYHFSALWADVEPLAEAGLAALACTIGQRRVTAHGGRRPLLGTNPIAFAWPRRQGPPFVFDFATSIVARGEVELRLRDGRALPPGWAVDRQGDPTTDPAAALAGALRPFGEHKGAALSMMVELIAGALAGGIDAGDGGAEDATGPRLGGALIIAFDPGRLAPPAPGSPIDRGEGLLAAIAAEEGARLPSARRLAARARSHRDGVPVPASLLEEVRRLTLLA